MFHRHLRAGAAAIAVTLSAQPSQAGLIDVQFSGTVSYVCGFLCAYTAPQQSGAAVVGSAGDQWNEVFASNASGLALTDTTGATTGLTLNFSADVAYTSAPYYDAFQGTAWANLMQGYLVNNISMTLNGLNPGQAYDLYMYTQGDNNSAGRAIGLTSTGGSAGIASQSNANSFIANDNYILLQPIADGSGTISIGEYFVSGEANLNGFQLVTTDIPEPGSLSVLGIGMLALAGATRRRSLAVRFRAICGNVAYGRGFIGPGRDPDGLQGHRLSIAAQRARFVVALDRCTLTHAIHRHRFVAIGPVEYI